MKKTKLLLAGLLMLSVGAIAQPNYWGNPGGPGISTFTLDNVGIGAYGPVTGVNLQINNGTGCLGGNTEIKLNRTTPIACSGPTVDPNFFEIWSAPLTMSPNLLTDFDGRGWLNINPQAAGILGDAKIHVTGYASGSGLPELKIDRIGSAGTVDFLQIYKSTPSGGVTFKDVIDYRGWLGINNDGITPLSQALDVNGNAHIGGGLIDMGMAVDASGRTITASTSTGIFSLEAGTGGAGMSMFGNGRTDRPGTFAFASAGPLVSTAATGPNGYLYYWYGDNGDGTGITWHNLMHMWNDGKVTIGGDLDSWVENATGLTPDGYKLFVSGGILTDKLKVAMHTDLPNWSDFVFARDYNLMPLNKVESYIKANKHLPEIPSAQEVSDNGIDVASMDAKLLQKIEELTLYVINQQKEIDNLKKKVNQ